MTTTVKIPRFEEGAIAFRRTAGGIIQAWKVFEFRLGRNRQPEYRLYRDGRSLWSQAADLLTGWESDFPGYDAIDWGSLHYRASDLDSDPDCTEADERELESEMHWAEVTDLCQPA